MKCTLSTPSHVDDAAPADELAKNVGSTTFLDKGILYAGSILKFFNDSLPSFKGINSLLPASKGEVQKAQSENDQQNLIINQLVKQVNALTPVSTVGASKLTLLEFEQSNVPPAASWSTI